MYMGLFLVVLNLNIPLILFVTMIINFVVISGLTEGNLRFLHFNILNSFDRFKKFFSYGIYKVIWGYLGLYERK